MPRHRDFKREARICKLYEERSSPRQIAKTVNVSGSTVRRVLGL